MVKRYLFVLFIILSCVFESTAQVPYWLRNANGPGNDEIYDIVQYQSDYYVTGYYSNNTTFDNFTLYAQQGGEAFVAKVNQNGNFVWVKRIGGLYSDKGIAISVMPNGNVIATGHFVETISIDNISITSASSSQDIFIACFSPTGTTLWAKKLGGAGIDIVSDLQCDSSNNILVTGQFIGKIILGQDSLESGWNPQTNNYSYDIFISKLNSQGDYLWSKHAITKKNDRSGKIAIGSDNSIFVSGNFTDTLTLGNVYQNNSLNMGFIVHYDENGQHLWFRRVQSSITEIMDIACSDSLLYMTGKYTGIQRFANDETVTNWQNVAFNPYDYKYYVAAYNYQGILQLSNTEGSNTAVTAKAIKPKPNGGYFLTGEFECQHSEYQSEYGSGLFISRGYSDLFVTEYSASNQRLWAKQIGSTGVDEVQAMVINSFGNPVFAGSFSNSLSSPAKNSWGSKPWYSEFTTNYGPAPYWEGEALQNYCGDSEYNFYAVVQSQGSRDMLIANIADTTRSTLDIFRRVPGDCILDPTFGSVESYAIEPCVNRLARALFSTASTHINGIDYTFNWNGQSSTNATYAPTVSGNVQLTASGANTCYSFSDSVWIDLFPVIPTPEVSITGAAFVNVYSPLFACNRSVIADPDSIVILTGNNPSPNFVYSWYLPGDIVLTSNVLTLNNDLLGAYAYVITDPLSGCSKSFCFILVRPDTAGTGGGGGVTLVDLRFRLGDRILAPNDTIYGCLNDEVELSLVNVVDPNNIVDANIPYFGTWSSFPGNVSVVNSTFATLSPHQKSFTLLSDSINNGSTVISISFHNGDPANPVYFFSQHYYISLYPQPIFSYSLTGDIQSICPGDTASFVFDTELNYDFNLDLGQNEVTSESPLSFYSVFPQTYLITMYDTTDMGCTDIKNLNFEMSYIQSPPIQVNPTDGIVCLDQEVILTVPGASEILWIGPSGDSLTTDLVYSTDIIGLYYSVIVDSNGCNQITSDVDIRDRSSFGYELSPTNICPGETATIQLFALEGDSIRWLPPFSGNALTQTTTTPGLYRFTAPLCGIIDTFDVIVPGPIYSAEIETLEDSLFCPGDTIILTSVNTTNVDLIWFSDYTSSPSIEVTESGSYILQLIDENACATLDTVEIEYLIAPEPPILPEFSSYCGIDSVILSTALGDSLVWILGTEQVAYSPDFVYYPEYFSDTLYIANYSNENGCKSQSVPYPIDVKTYLEVPLVNTSYTLCQGDSFDILVTPRIYGASDYLIYIPLNNSYITSSDSSFSIAQVTPANSGTYALIFTGDADSYCSGDTILISLEVLPVPQLTILSSDEYLCSDEIVNFWVNSDPSIATRNWSYYGVPYFQDTLSISNAAIFGLELELQYNAVLQNGCEINLIDTFQRGIRPPNPYYLDSLTTCSGDIVDLVLPDSQVAYWYIGTQLVTPNAINTYQFLSYVNHPPITVVNSDLFGVCPTDTINIPINVKPRINIPDISDYALCPGVPRIFTFNPASFNAETFYWKDMIADTIISYNENQITVPAAETTIGLYAIPFESGCGTDSTIFNITVQTLPELTVTSLQNDTICLNNGIAYSASTSNVVSTLGAYLNGSTGVASVCSNCSTHDFLLANSVVPGLQLGQNTIRTRVYTYGACLIERTDTFEVITQADPNFAMDDLQVCVGDTLQIQFPGTGIYDWIESNTFNYLTYPYYGIAIPFDVYASAASSIDYVVEDTSPSLYITSVDPETQCRSGFYQVPILIKPSIDLPPFSSYSICAYDSVLIDFSPSEELIGNYSWTFPNGSLSQDTTFLIYGADSIAMGQYELIAYANELSCGADSATFNLVSYEVPEVDFVIDSFHVCTDRPWRIVANVSANAQIDWNYDGNTSQNNPLIINYPSFAEDSLLISGVFTTPFGCVVNKSVKIAVYQTPDTPDLTVPSIICAQDTVLLTLNNFLQADQQFQYESNVYFGENGNQLIFIPGSQDTLINVLSYLYTDHCISDTLINILKVHQLPIFNLGNDSLLFCLGVGTQLNGPSGYSSYLWSTGDLMEDIEVFETGTYSLLVADEQGCLFTDTIFVLGEWPIFQLQNDTIEFCFGDPLLVNAPSGFDFYQWNTGSTQNFIKITETGEYILVITDLNGCTYSDTLYALGGDCEVQNQPNVFTPNGDGFNDKFTINPFGMNSYKMVIHDRWGKFVRTVASSESGWDGKDQFGQEMLEGVYYFVATVEFMNKSNEEIKGMIQLLK